MSLSLIVIVVLMSVVFAVALFCLLRAPHLSISARCMAVVAFLPLNLICLFGYTASTEFSDRHVIWDLSYAFIFVSCLLAVARLIFADKAKKAWYLIFWDHCIISFILWQLGFWNCLFLLSDKASPICIGLGKNRQSEHFVILVIDLLKAVSLITRTLFQFCLYYLNRFMEICWICVINSYITALQNEDHEKNYSHWRYRNECHR